MDVEAPAALWPPHVGDYARLKHGGPLGEVIDASRGGEGWRYVLNLFTPNPDAPLVYRLEDLEPIWPSRPERDAAQTWDDAASPSWSTSWPSWTR
jgi:hypothetical protein